MPEADLNVVLYPEMGLDAARFMNEHCGTPYYVCPTLPIGFAATEAVFSDICALLGASVDSLIEERRRSRALAWYKINAIHMSFGKPKGVKFHVAGNESQVKSYGAFLTDYLGMESSGPDDAELVFAEANLISELMLRNKTFCGIEISLPGMGYTDLLPKTHMGIQGALFLIEQVLNGLMSKL